MNTINQDNIEVINNSNFRSFYELFAVIPKFVHSFEDYEVNVFELDNDEGYVLSLSNFGEEYSETMKDFFKGLKTLNVENTKVEEDICSVKFLRPCDCAEMLLYYLEENPDGLNADLVKAIENKVSDLIKTTIVDPEMQRINTAQTPEDMICDAFNEILSIRGFERCEADYDVLDEQDEDVSADDLGAMEVCIRCDGELTSEFESFIDELVEDAEDTGIVPTIEEGKSRLYLMAETPMQMVKLLKVVCNKYALATVEDMIKGGVVCESSSVISDGGKYLETLSDEQRLYEHPMVPTVSGDSASIATLFYLKSNEPFRINLDRIETEILQRQRNYKGMQDRHRAFIIH